MPSVVGIGPIGGDAHRAVAAKLLAGVRGQRPIDDRAVEDVLLRVSQLFEDCPEIRELDINPLMTYPDGAVAADARVVLGG